MNTLSSFSQHLQNCCATSWMAAIEHRFVNELFAGTIDDRVLARYLVQDYQFFDPFLQLLGAAISVAPTSTARMRLCKQLAMLVNDENGYFIKSFDKLGVNQQDRINPKLSQATKTMIVLMEEAIASQSWLQQLALLIVFEWLYLQWADNPVHTQMPTRPEHVGWIELHRGDEFRKWVDFLRAEFDAVAPAQADDQAACASLFSRAVSTEVAFFEAAYDTSLDSVTE